MTTTSRAVDLSVCAVGLVVAWYFVSGPVQEDGTDDEGQGRRKISEDVIHAISGSVGSALSITVFYPLETVRTRLQVGDTSFEGSNSIQATSRLLRNEGLSSLYRGWYSLVATLMIMNFVYFYCFHTLRRRVGDLLIASREVSANKAVVDLMAGYLAGCVAVMITGPLWLVNTRLKLQYVKLSKEGAKQPNKTYSGILHCLYNVAKDEGVLTLWNGTVTSIILSLNPAIQLGVYEMFKRRHLISFAGQDMEHFCNALLAKFVSTILTYPIQVIQTMQRANVKETSGQSGDDSWLDRVLKLYRGLESKLLQTCLNSALMFVAYERLVNLLSEYLTAR